MQTSDPIGFVDKEAAVPAPLAIEAHGLSLTFETSDGKVEALSNVDLGFRPEKILVASASVPSSNLESARRRHGILSPPQPDPLGRARDDDRLSGHVEWRGNHRIPPASWDFRNWRT